jgi:regulation of enolase protein 1 (concanavalin A-like superfamily)
VAGALLFPVCGAASAEPVGLFQDHSDIGGPMRAGQAAYDAASRTYAVAAGGSNMFGAHDEFHFVWRRLNGDFSIQARIAFTGPGAEPHRKAGLMARGGLDADAPYVDATVHGDGPQALQVRRAQGGETEMLVTAPDAATSLGPADRAAPGADFVRLERRGNVFTVTEKRFGKTYTSQQVAAPALGDEVYVGLFLCAHDPAGLEHAAFRDVRLDAPPPGPRR